MSISVEYCFNVDGSAEEVASRISSVLGCSLEAHEGRTDDFSGRLLGIELHLHADHGCKNDGDLNFEDYRFIIGNCTYSGESDLRPIQVEVLATTAFLLHQRLGIHEGMLTYELQRLLARYELHEIAWFDLVSQKPVQFPEHLVDIRARIEEQWKAA